MAEDVGALVARVVADTEGFRSEMTRMARLVQSNTARMNSQLSRIGKAGDAMAGSFRIATRVLGAFGVALSVRALVQFTTQSINAAAELQNLSVRLNASVESLSELQYVARLTDVEFKTFTNSLQIMTRNFGEAAKGSKSMQDTFRQLGLDFKLLSTLTIDQQLEAVAEALNRVQNESNRASFAQEVFGRGGVELLQSLEGGAAGLRKMRQEARDFGAVLSGDTAKAADEAKDAMDRLSASVSVLFQEATIKLAPALTTIAEKLREAFFPSDAEAAAQAAKKELEDRKRLLSETATELAKYQDILAADPDSKNTSLHANISELTKRVSLLRSEVLDAQFALDGLLSAQAARAAEPAAAIPGLVAPGQRSKSLNDRMRDAGFEVSTGLQTIGSASEALGGSSSAEANEAFRKNEEETTEIVEENWQRRLQAATDATAGMLEVVQYHAEQEIMWRETVTNSAIGLLSALGSKHRGAAIAALAIQKALAVKEILIQSQVAAMRALAELGPIAGPPVAASFLLKGRISAALVAATGLVEAAQLSGGGTSSTLGTTANPINTRSTSASGPNIAPHSQKVVEITIHGGVVTSSAVRELVTQIKKEIDDSDVIIFGPDSRQARLLESAA